jgi:hypothetical protein
MWRGVGSMRLVEGLEMTFHTITQVSFEPLTTTFLLEAKHVMSALCSRKAERFARAHIK